MCANLKKGIRIKCIWTPQNYVLVDFAHLSFKGNTVWLISKASLHVRMKTKMLFLSLLFSSFCLPSFFPLLFLYFSLWPFYQFQLHNAQVEEDLH